MAAPLGHLLDTNVLVHLIRWKSVGQTMDRHFGLRATLNRSVISIVTVGEMHSLARQLAWGSKKLAAIQALLGNLVALDINHPSILDGYGELDAFSVRAGRPMGKNDVWIAATAKATGLTLLTTDAGFDHLSPDHLSLVRIDQRTGNPLE